MVTISLRRDELREIVSNLAINIRTPTRAADVINILRKFKKGISSRFEKSLIQSEISDLLMEFPVLGPKKRVKK